MCGDYHITDTFVHVLFKEPDVTVMVKTARFWWAGLVIEMSDSEMPKTN
jgi:hypothetical protein